MTTGGDAINEATIISRLGHRTALMSRIGKDAAAIVDIPLQPVSKNIFDVDSYPLERIAMTTGGDAINEATIISRLGHRTALMSRIGKDAA
ncbi:PfkB family carbohydrate kinase, partial [Klebsiella pneumoniae]|uniref:PfkB family carbohydrate kinase n=1 Tax=Klebsiella pneumoniae TaxID=573 RepID=UPI001155E9CE